MKRVVLALVLSATGCGDSGESSGGGESGSGGSSGATSGGAAGVGGAGGSAASGGAGSGGVSCEASEQRCGSLSETERPFRPSEHGIAFAEDTLELVLFGGTQGVSVQCQTPPPAYIAETWIYDRPCDVWQRVSGPGPEARGRHAMAYGDGAVWTFGGRFREAGTTSGNYTLFNDLWRFDVAARVWTRVEAIGTPPAARSNTSLVWDSKRSRLWLFGGNGSSSAAYQARADVWSFDPSTNAWAQHSVSGGPSPRFFHAATYDAQRDAMVVYGGADETLFSPTARYFQDMWSLSLESLTWQELAPAITARPTGRFWPGLAYDPANDRYLVYGGHDDQVLGNRNDLWAMSPAEGSWQELASGDTLQNSDTGVCDFPVDFTAIDAAAPERRHAQGAAFSAVCGELLVVGGKTDCGVVDDVWSFGQPGWRELRAATEGEACLRWRSDTSLCNNLCN